MTEGNGHVIDPAGEARQALQAAVAEHGPEALSNAVIMDGICQDRLSDLPGEAILIGSAARTDVPALLRDLIPKMGNYGAIQSVATTLAEAHGLDTTACLWVVREFARVLGLIASGGTYPTARISAAEGADQGAAPTPTPTEPPAAAGGAAAGGSGGASEDAAGGESAIAGESAGAGPVSGEAAGSTGTEGRAAASESPESGAAASESPESGAAASGSHGDEVATSASPESGAAASGSHGDEVAASASPESGTAASGSHGDEVAASAGTAGIEAAGIGAAGAAVEGAGGGAGTPGEAGFPGTPGGAGFPGGAGGPEGPRSGWAGGAEVPPGMPGNASGPPPRRAPSGGRGFNRNTVGVAAAIALVAGYLGVAAVAHLSPFPAKTVAATPSPPASQGNGASSSPDGSPDATPDPTPSSDYQILLSKIPAAIQGTNNCHNIGTAVGANAVSQCSGIHGLAASTIFYYQFADETALGTGYNNFLTNVVKFKKETACTDSHDNFVDFVAQCESAFTSTTPSMTGSIAEYTNKSNNPIIVTSDDQRHVMVVMVGANDGDLLAYWKKLRWVVA